MKMEILYGSRLPSIGLVVWGMMLVFVVSSTGCVSGTGGGFAQNSQEPVFFQRQPASQGQLPPPELPPPVTQPPVTQPSGAMWPGQSVPPAQGGFVLNNNAMLPNQGHATFNTATQEVRIPFEMDSQLLAFSVVVDDSKQTLTVVDPINRAMAVYHVHLNGPNTGKIEPKSFRNISGDLKFDAYEAMSPLPSEVRAVVNQAERQRERIF